MEAFNARGISRRRLLAQTSWREVWSEAPLLSPVAPGVGSLFLPTELTAELTLQHLDLSQDLQEKEQLAGWQGYSAEFLRLLRLALPLSVTSLAAFALGLVTVAYVGRLGEYQLSVAVLATSIFNATGLAVLTGFAAAMESLCGQAFGAGRYRLVGVVLQRAVLLTCLLVAAVAGLWSSAERLLIASGQDPALSAGAARYLALATPALLFTGLFEVLKRYLMTQGEVRPATAATIIALALSPLYNYALIIGLGWGLDGAALAVDAVQGTMVCGLGVYVALRDRRLRGQPTATWRGWSAEALGGWGDYFKVALPSVIMVCAEWWTFQAIIVMSGLLPQPQLAVGIVGVVYYISTLVYSMISGVGLATSVHVSNALGAGRPQAARRTVGAALLLMLCLEAVAVAVVVGAHQHLPYLFTDVKTVAEAAAGLLPILAVALPGDGFNACLQGLLRGAGKQGLGAITNLALYWAVGIPLAAWLAFKLQWGVAGLWWGLAAVNSLQGAAMLGIAMCLNYRELADKASSVLRRQSTITRPLLGEEAGAGTAPAGGSLMAEQHQEGRQVNGVGEQQQQQQQQEGVEQLAARRGSGPGGVPAGLLLPSPFAATGGGGGEGGGVSAPGGA